jgi:radical SAM superfamily enzyme YgiQ (UPF0313 family)
MLQKLLLTSVFGPFAVDDRYGRKENKIELFHNQVTREQGIFSYRFNHSSFGLNMLAENISVPTTVLDFPTLSGFRKELEKGYTHVGISFIMTNFDKARKMAAVVRDVAPGVKIILGGHGTNIDHIEDMIEHDYICKGEGVMFMRRLFGEKLDKPVKHPVMYSSYNRKVMGVPIPNGSGILVPGVGCANKCRFCSTSHFFGEYTAYLETGRQIYDLCCDYEDSLGVTDFGVLDENFMKMPQRAFGLIELMQKHKRYFNFGIFSSAETLTSLPDLDVLVRLGVTFIWMGVESKKESYEKNKGVDFKILVDELRKRGISVMTSIILFTEDHDKRTIWDDVDFGIELNSDYVQYMQLGPIPGTKLYKDYEREGRLDESVPLMNRHGQDRIWFHHPNFTGDESREYLTRAFKKDYEVNGASFIRVMKTTLNGYKYTINHKDPLIRDRAQPFKALALMTRHFLLASGLLSENKATSRLIRELKAKYNELFGSGGLKEAALNIAVAGLAIKEKTWIRLFNDVRQPPLLITKYRMDGDGALECKPMGIGKIANAVKEPAEAF